MIGDGTVELQKYQSKQEVDLLGSAAVRVGSDFREATGIVETQGSQKQGMPRSSGK